jgi:GNAT superfamily N-acetyltransferase
MEIRRASVADAELLAGHRAAVWHEVGDWNLAELEPQIPIWADFFREHMADGSYAAFVAERDGRTIGSGGLVVYLAIPRPGRNSDRAGRVQSVFVDQSFRRRGVARSIMDRILLFAREANLISLVLHPSDEGRPLYTSLGFEPADEMMLRLT